jgi:putative ubiquitin-RnfH superfamily antitoxin RatB of RatAB toxin-antitoxin module
VAWSPGPRAVTEVELVLPAGSTVATAIQAILARQERPASPQEGQTAMLSLGAWGQKVESTRVLTDRDRVEIYRPLKVDPKIARRERFKKQGPKKAGLFAVRRAGAKTGY